MIETLFKSPCLSLRNEPADDNISLKLSAYYRWRHANLWEADVQITGNSEYITRFEFEDREEKTNLTCNARTIKTRNDNRENFNIILKEDGTTAEEKLTDFNPPGTYGKIPDENLIRLRHEPCFNECSFTAFVHVQKIWSNYLIFQDLGAEPPKKPLYWSSWSYSVDQVYTDEEHYRDMYHINGIENMLWTVSLIVRTGQINPATLKVNPVYFIQGPVILSNNLSDTSVITIDGHAKSAGVLLPEGLNASLVWSNNTARPI